MRIDRNDPAAKRRSGRPHRWAGCPQPDSRSLGGYGQPARSFPQPASLRASCGALRSAVYGKLISLRRSCGANALAYKQARHTGCTFRANTFIINR